MTVTKKTTKKTPAPKKTPKLAKSEVASGEKEIKVEPVENKKKRVRHTYLYAVGRRKNAIARTRLIKNGTGAITINGKDFTQYFPTFELQQLIKQPLEAVSKLKDFDFTIRVQGGGVHGQAEAVRHGLARVLVIFDRNLKAILKPFGYLTRDSRRKERKKPGLKRARKAPQWAKR